MIKAATMLFTVIALAAVGESQAHTRSESYSHWYMAENNLTGVVTIPLREVMLLYTNTQATIPADQLFAQHLEETIGVRHRGKECERLATNKLAAPSGFIRAELEFGCASGTPQEIGFRAMFDVAPAHVNFARLHRDDIQLGEALLTGSADTWQISSLQTNESWSFTSFVKLGVEHIAGGVDHIAFLFGLLLIAGSVGRSIFAITGFTLGHSVSLAAAVLGYVSADSQLVEAFIGFTVMLVAVEFFLLQRSDTSIHALTCALVAWAAGLLALTFGFVNAGALWTYLGFGAFAYCYLAIAAAARQRDEGRNETTLLLVATSCFGLIHGFGFAGFLMDSGLLGNRLFVPLLGFNLGVEIGQLVIVAAVVLATKFMRQFIPQVVPQLVAAGLCGIGVFWFVGRTLS